MLGIHRRLEGEPSRNGVNVSWIRGPQVILYWESPWFSIGARLRWRLWARCVHVGYHWWPRERLDLNDKIIGLIKSREYDAAEYQRLKAEEQQLNALGKTVINYRRQFGWSRKAV